MPRAARHVVASRRPVNDAPHVKASAVADVSVRRASPDSVAGGHVSCSSSLRCDHALQGDPQCQTTRRNRTSSSSGATTSAGSTSARTTTASWGTARRTSTASRRRAAIFTDWYGQQSCTAGRAAFITGQSPIRTGLTKVGLARRRPRASAGRPDDRRRAEAARLRDRPVRQEPSRRPRRVPADRARLRRVLRQSLPPERRAGAGESRTIRRIPSSRRSSGRAACSTAGPTPTARRRSRTPAR